jgi:Haem-binding domain
MLRVKKIFKYIFVVLIIALIGIQFYPSKKNSSNEILASDFRNIYDVPEKIDAYFEISCYNCHSNNSTYPWYVNIQPVALFMANHINEGKEELNFSDFGSYSKRRKKNKLKSVINQIRKNQMPIESYTLIHRDAKLSESEKKEIIDWVNSLLRDL